MSSARDRAIEGLRASCNSILRGMVRLPLSIMEGISGVTGHGAPRRDHENSQPQQHPHEAPVIPEEWFFLTLFEREFSTSHPFFYACRFTEALKIAKDESKFLFVYLHDPGHPYTAPFCHGTLCSAPVVEFIDANFVSWGAVATRGEGLEMAMALKATSFPFCAVVSPASGDSITVLQQVVGPVPPEELIDILQRTIEEQGSAFRASKAQEEEKIQANRRIREEQDAAYQESLQKDKEKDQVRDILVEDGTPQTTTKKRKRANEERLRRTPAPRQSMGQSKETSKEAKRREKMIPENAPVTKIRIRFPDGARKDQSFLITDNIRSLYRYIDSLDMPGIGSYRLITSFPREVYGYEKLETTLGDAGFHPNITIFLELL